MEELLDVCVYTYIGNAKCILYTCMFKFKHTEHYVKYAGFRTPGHHKTVGRLNQRSLLTS